MIGSFVDSDPDMVRMNTKNLKESLELVDMSLLEGDAHMTWMKILDVLNSDINTLVDTKDLAKQRKMLSSLSATLFSSLKTFGLHHGTFYYQYCPMANGDEGAYWISTIKEINNPYFGDEMLRCGETRETVKF